MKVNVFEVTSRRVAILDWSVSLCVVFMLLQLSEKYGQHIDELTADGFSVADTASKVTPLLWFCGLLVPFCSLLAWEQLRHALLKANHYWLQLMQIVVMVLTFLGVVVAVIPSDTAQMVHGTSLLGGFAKFQLAFPFYNNIAIGIVNLCLGVGIARLFGGRVRLYGIGLAVLPVLSMLVGEFYTYLYTSVGGLTLQALDTYRITMLVVQFVLQLVLWVLMFRAFASTDD